jgi:hypothetical protein
LSQTRVRSAERTDHLLSALSQTCDTCVSASALMEGSARMIGVGRRQFLARRMNASLTSRSPDREDDPDVLCLWHTHDDLGDVGNVCCVCCLVPIGRIEGFANWDNQPVPAFAGFFLRYPPPRRSQWTAAISQLRRAATSRQSMHGNPLMAEGLSIRHAVIAATGVTRHPPKDTTKCRLGDSPLPLTKGRMLCDGHC